MKRLLMITLGIAAMCQSACSHASPSVVVKAFMRELNARNYSAAERLVDPPSLEQFNGNLKAPSGFRSTADYWTKNGTVTKFEIIGEQVRGEAALVTARITYRDGTNANDTTHLILRNGIWKIDVGHGAWKIDVAQ